MIVIERGPFKLSFEIQSIVALVFAFTIALLMLRAPKPAEELLKHFFEISMMVFMFFFRTPPAPITPPAATTGEK